MLKKFLSSAVVLSAFAVSAALPPAVVDMPLDEGDVNKITNTAPNKVRVRVTNPEFMQWVEGANGQALQFNNADGKVKRGQVAFQMPAKLDISKGFSWVYTAALWLSIVHFRKTFICNTPVEHIWSSI